MMVVYLLSWKPESVVSVCCAPCFPVFGIISSGDNSRWKVLKDGWKREKEKEILRGVERILINCQVE